MQLVTFDHILSATLAIALPLYGRWSFPQLQRAVALGTPDARLRAYALTAIQQWTLVACVAALWQFTERPWSLLGIQWPGGWRAWMGLGLVSTICALYVAQIIAATKKPETLAALRPQVAQLVAVAPSTDAEARAFVGLSITAGICEETLYRGFLIWYLTEIVGAWPGICIAAIAFGAGHSYQGLAGFFKTTAIGLASGALLMFMQSLWPLMALHAIVDVSGGKLLRLALQTPAAASDDEAKPVSP